MASFISPRFITSGLVLYLDAANTNSVPRSGTGCTDLSLNVYAGTLVNGTTVTNFNLGALSFDGVNDYVNLPYTILSGVGDFTVGAWILANTATAVTTCTVFGNYPAGNLQLAYSANNLGLRLGNTSTFVPTPGSLYNENLNYITAVRSGGTTTTFYINTVPVSTGSSNVNIGSVNNFRIGLNTSDSEPFTGNIYNIHAYNRALSSSEIEQNYNAFRSRYEKVFRSFVADYLVVAGGGGGGGASAPGPADQRYGGGGGAGGFRQITSATLSTGVAYPITIGAGGTGNPATAGNNSIFNDAIAAGGGRGGNSAPAGAGSGGSGGGGIGGTTQLAGGAGNTPATIPAQGFSGGTGQGGGAGGGGAAGAGIFWQGNSPYLGTGEGGPGEVTNISIGTVISNSSVTIGSGSKTFTVPAGLAITAGTWIRAFNDSNNYMYGTVTSYSGTSLTINVPANSGATNTWLRFNGTGTLSSWTISVAFAGGGGGSAPTGGTLYGNTIGGGGNGGSPSIAGTAGTANMGGGGGADNAGGKSGGSGIVILRIPNTRTATFSAGVTWSLNTAVAGFNIYTITATSTANETVTFN